MSCIIILFPIDFHLSISSIVVFFYILKSHYARYHRGNHKSSIYHTNNTRRDRDGYIRHGDSLLHSRYLGFYQIRMRRRSEEEMTKQDKIHDDRYFVDYSSSFPSSSMTAGFGSLWL